MIMMITSAMAASSSVKPAWFCLCLFMRSIWSTSVTYLHLELGGRAASRSAGDVDQERATIAGTVLCRNADNTRAATVESRQRQSDHQTIPVSYLRRADGADSGGVCHRERRSSRLLGRIALAQFENGGANRRGALRERGRGTCPRRRRG